MAVLSINDNDDNDQVNPVELISSLGLRFSNFSPVGFVREGLPGNLFLFGLRIPFLSCTCSTLSVPCTVHMSQVLLGFLVKLQSHFSQHHVLQTPFSCCNLNLSVRLRWSVVGQHVALAGIHEVLLAPARFIMR